jgi:hypothetical protein
LARSPTERRKQQALDFVSQRETSGNRIAALSDLAHVLFNSSEFITIE